MDEQREWTRLITKSDSSQVNASYKKLDAISKQLSIALEMLQGEAEWRGNGGLLAAPRNLYDHIVATVSQYMQWQESSTSHYFKDDDGSHCLDEFSSSVNSLTKSVLKSVQHLVLSQNSDDRKEGELLDAQKDYLTDLHNKTTDRLQRLKIDKICQAVKDITSSIQTAADLPFYNLTPDGKKGFFEAVKRLAAVTPLLSTYVVLSSWLLYESITVHATLCHLLTDMLHLFNITVAKGFGTPVKNVEGDGEVDLEDLDPTGMGEGEGIKDVSDQIESEDQLLDTNQAGDCANQRQDELGAKVEGEHAIEMSSDIDAPFDDIQQLPCENDEDSDNSEDSKRNEIGECMGEIDGPGEEELDQRIWANDSEDESECPAGDEQNRKGFSSQTTDSQLVAMGDSQVSEDHKQEKHQPKNEDDAMDTSDGEELDRNEDMNDTPANLEAEPVPSSPSDLAADLPDNIVIDDGNDNEEVPDLDLLDAPTEMDQEEEKNVASGDDVDHDVDTMIDTSIELHEEPENFTEPSSSGLRNMEDKMEDFQDAPDTSGVNASGPWENCVTQMDSGLYGSAMELTGTYEHAGLPRLPRLEKSQTASAGDQEEQEGENDISDCGYEEKTQASSRHSIEETLPRRFHFSRSNSNRQQDLGVEPNAKKLKVLDKDDSEFEVECETQDKGESAESETYQHLPLNDSRENDHVTVAAATENQAKTGVGAAADNRVLEEQVETNYDLERLTSTAEEDSDKLEANAKVPGIAAQTHESSTNGSDIGVNSIIMSAEQQEDGWQNSKSFVGSGIVLSERYKIDVDALRHELEIQLAMQEKGKCDLMAGAVAAETWAKYSMLTAQLSYQLCEQLRLVLEPTESSQLKGDYRTGKRLNMKKIIPYVASQFRKDKIWLRRTKPSKRHYQIMIAIDDSSSMSDNQSKQMAFEALAVISNALQWLESGELGVCSFGESARILHQLNEPFTDQSGSNIICQFSFQQKKTRIANMLQECTLSMLSARKQSMSYSQLLLIISDGRGIFVEGTKVVRSAIRKAHGMGISIVFIILDNPSNKDSVMDIVVPVFHSGEELPSISSYMAEFPFPFYIVLRDITRLPETLSDALRQWFEFTTVCD